MRPNHNPIACFAVVAGLCYVSTARGQVNCCLLDFPSGECFQVADSDACNFDDAFVVDTCDECLINCCLPTYGCFQI